MEKEFLGVPDVPSIYISNGMSVPLREPEVEHVDLGSIAHSLGNLCRYNGHTRRFYSVAEHNLLVEALYVHLYPNDHEGQFYAALHDGHESIVGDLVTPMKCELKDTGVIDHWDTMTYNWDQAIFARFGMPMPSNEQKLRVKECDLIALQMEFEALMPLPLLHTDMMPPVPKDFTYDFFEGNELSYYQWSNIYYDVLQEYEEVLCVKNYN